MLDLAWSAGKQSTQEVGLSGASTGPGRAPRAVRRRATNTGLTVTSVLTMGHTDCGSFVDIGRAGRRRVGAEPRERLHWYPDDLWRWVLAAQWRRGGSGADAVAGADHAEWENGLLIGYGLVAEAHNRFDPTRAVDPEPRLSHGRPWWVPVANRLVEACLAGVTDP